MKTPPLDYVCATSIADAVQHLAAHEGAARVLAGGQSLVPMMAMRLAQPALLVDINRIRGLGSIAVEDGVLRIGALARYSEIERSSLVARAVPLLGDALSHVGDRLVRNRGTLVGSLVQADPSAEGPLVAAALDASVVAHGPAGTRRLPVSTLIVGPYETSLDPGELVAECQVPVVPGRRHVFVEAKRRHGDYAMVMVAAVGLPAAEPGAWRRVALSVGAVADRVLHVEVLPSGGGLDDGAIERAVERVSDAADPVGDVRASAEYRRHLARLYAARALRRLARTWAQPS